MATLSESGQSWQVSVPRPPAAGGLQEPDLGYKKENRILWWINGFEIYIII